MHEHVAIISIRIRTKQSVLINAQKIPRTAKNEWWHEVKQSVTTSFSYPKTSFICD